jgi:DHA3 family macrolide efflux protein-like MFS transporter
VILLGIVAGLVLGLLAGGRLGGLLNVHLRWVGLIFLALVLRVGTQVSIARDSAVVDELRLPLYVGAFGILALALWLNRHEPGLIAAAIGVASNGFAVLVNGGWMPVWQPALDASGLGLADLDAAFHRALPLDFGIDFFLRAGPLADVIPLPLGPLASVFSVGDAFIGAGLGWFLFSALVRRTPETEGSIAFGPAWPVSAGRVAESGLGLERPMVLGSGLGPGLSEQLPVGARIRGHPYVRLALDTRFASFWLAQAISLFGDRLHQVALAVLALALTNSPLATGLVFLAATLPNLILSPIAGTFVDRLNHRRVMIASDLLRAALVLALPFAAQVNVALIYPLVFVITTVSLFFRPAKIAVVPRIVAPDDVLAANSATWTADTLADIAGYPLAGLFVYFLGASIGLAFFVDAATYLLSAVLIASIAIPPIARTVVPAVGGAVRAFFGELTDGWHFLRGEPALIQNTLISALAQASIGVTLALNIVYARDALDGSLIPYPANYAAIDTAIGVGNLVGGLAVGLIGARLRKGWLVVGGFVIMGLATVVLGLTSNVLLALVAAAVIGIANLVYVIPTQTIFIELTPAEMMGRVVSFRSSLVFGSMMAAMAVSGVLAEHWPVGVVIAASGVLTALAGVIGALLPAVRDQG